MSTSHLQPRDAGWYPDPAGGQSLRWHDGQGWTAQLSYAHPPKPLGAGFAHLGDWVSRMLGAYAAVLTLMVCYLLWGVGLARRAARTPGFDLLSDPPQVPPDLQRDLDHFLVVGLVLFLALSVVSVITGLLWAVWQHRLAVSAPGRLRRSPGMQVASWVIPFVSYWWPLQNMGDLWRAYGAGRQETTAQASPLLLPLWWGTFVVQPVVGLLGFAVLTTAQQPDQLLSRVLLIYVAQFLVLMVGAVLARQVVQRLSWRALMFFAEQPGA